MRDEEIAVLAGTSTDEVVILAVGALISPRAGFAMRQDGVALLAFVVGIEEVRIQTVGAGVCAYAFRAAIDCSVAGKANVVSWVDVV